MERFWYLKDVTKNFFKKTATTFLKFMKNSSFLIYARRFIHHKKKQNEVNIRLQGQHKFITDCNEDIKAFVTKLNPYES